MLPDFSNFRKGQRDRISKDAQSASNQSANPSAGNGFANRYTSQRFNKLSAHSTASPSERDFFALWTAYQSWSPILLKPSGWITIVNPSGKKVPLVPGTVESHYRRGLVLGKRFGKLTNYLMVDVDTGSPFHPRSKGIAPILAAMEAIGLCRYLLVRSSSSEGLHLYFPLKEAVSSYGLACAAHAALSAAGVRVAGGVCELFPNKKAFNAEHNGHRLPLQAGSFLLDDDFRCIGNDKAAFMQQWQHCARGQDEALLADVLAEKPLPMPKRISVSSLPPIAWTRPGQSNEVMKELVNYGDRFLGLKTIPALGDWMVAVAPQLTGFEQFASSESKNDLTRKNWAYRWAKSHFKSARLYAATSSFDHNAVVAAEALERLMVALDKFVVVGKVGIKKLWKGLSEISKGLFGVGFGWKLFQKHRKLILERIGRSQTGGLSSSEGEGKNLSDLEADMTLDLEPEKRLTELSTARCETPSNDEGLSASTPPIEGDEAGGQVEAGEEAEAVGEVIRATAQQLLSVLGKACPFSGEGLWTVRRKEVSIQQWQRLSKLVGESH
ncbi:MAG: hypothetical protein AAFQ40_13105 [Cyanobacteria bacterium J06623_5]